ncbi:asparagine synthase-related protein [Kitasatospora sp. NPDC091207]|uniref:asparagine synthase-related protein n=1 Tax=Kitasatospora sp. NPDC091207 TaxID=3364083 RepID=UPI00381E8AE4
MSGHPRTWFVVLPDTEAPSAVAAVQDTGAARVLHHPSGRPWIIGDWPAAELVDARAGRVHVAVLGHGNADAGTLRRHAERAADATDPDALAGRLAGRLDGSFHLLVSAHGTVRAQGTLSGLRRLHHARLHGVPVLADRADVLAELTGQSVATERLALRLLHPLPHPLALLPLWTGVEPVPYDHGALLTPDGSVRTVRRWRPPAPRRSPAEAAEALGAALERAVAARTAAGGLVASDLSGGLDSTPLSFLAARGPSELLTVTFGSVDRLHEDARWADAAAAELPGARLLVGADTLPAMFAGLEEPGEQGDEPFAWTRTRARDEHVARELGARGARLRISGEGGDEVLQLLPAYLRALARRHPVTAARQLSGHRARLRWPLRSSLRALADRRTYRDWLADAAEEIEATTPPPGTTLLGWGMPPRLPPWAAAGTIRTVRAQLLAALDGAEPLAPEHAQHQLLHMVQHSAGAMRQAVELTARVGTPYTVPFLDDHVLDACLAADLALRGTPFAYKPLLTRAMAGLVPEHLLRRTGKGDFSPDAYEGLDRHRRQLADLTQRSALAEAGLIDASSLRLACVGLYPPGTSYAALDATLGCEQWLRARTAHRTAPGTANGGPGRTGDAGRASTSPIPGGH